MIAVAINLIIIYCVYFFFVRCNNRQSINIGLVAIILHFFAHYLKEKENKQTKLFMAEMDQLH